MRTIITKKELCLYLKHKKLSIYRNTEDSVSNNQELRATNTLADFCGQQHTDFGDYCKLTTTL